MKIVIFQEEERLEESLSSFQDLFYSRQMRYLASDLLQEGLSPKEIKDAVQRAMTSCQTAEIELRKHFSPVYTQIKGTLVNDCKLSRLGYGLVLLNADVSIPVAAQWQVKILSEFLK